VLTAYAFEAQRTRHIDYLDVLGHVHELWWNSDGWHNNDLTNAADCPSADQAPLTSYIFVAQGTQHVDYIDLDHLHIVELSWLPKPLVPVPAGPIAG
jgi:hypothetical protein